MGNGSGTKVLRDVLEIRDDVHSGDFKVELTAGVADEAKTKQLIDEYVVTDQLRKAFADALNLVKAAYTTRTSHAAYLHGSFGSGKSHFLTVLHAVLNNDTDARAKAGLQPVIADHDSWLRGRSFLMVPYHLVGATDITSALLSGYVRTVGEKHDKAPTPAVYRDQQLMADARRQRQFSAMTPCSRNGSAVVPGNTRRPRAGRRQTTTSSRWMPPRPAPLHSLGWPPTSTPPSTSTPHPATPRAAA